jgi:hypothetical protein
MLREARVVVQVGESTSSAVETSLLFFGPALNKVGFEKALVAKFHYR